MVWLTMLRHAPAILSAAEALFQRATMSRAGDHTRKDAFDGCNFFLVGFAPERKANEGIGCVFFHAQGQHNVRRFKRACGTR